MYFNYFILIFFLFFSFQDIYSQTNSTSNIRGAQNPPSADNKNTALKKVDKIKKKRPLYTVRSPIDFSISMALGYQSIVYHNQEESASENLISVSSLLSYFPASFLGFSLEAGFGFSPTTIVSNLKDESLVFFPEDISNFLFFTDIQTEFLFYTKSDNLLYTIIGFNASYISQSSLKSPSIKFKNSKNNMLALKVGFGDRFALFKNTILDINLNLRIPFQKTTSWINTGSRQWDRFIIGFEVGFGYFK